MGSIPIPSSNTESPYSGNIVEFLWALKKKGYKDSTIKENYSKVLRNISKNCKLDDPDSVLSYVATKEISEGRKEVMIDCYSTYCTWKGIPFSKPRYRKQSSLPYVPLELDIEALISALPRKLGIFTRALKDTGARCGELWRVKWIDIDFQNNTITINNPEKGSRARRLKVSTQLIGLISTLARNSDYVFRRTKEASLDSLATYYMRERKKLSKTLNNPKIQSITWKSLRH